LLAVRFRSTRLDLGFRHRHYPFALGSIRKINRFTQVFLRPLFSRSNNSF
jgi:hypothetical protein